MIWYCVVLCSHCIVLHYHYGRSDFVVCIVFALYVCICDVWFCVGVGLYGIVCYCIVFVMFVLYCIVLVRIVFLLCCVVLY